MSDFALWDKKLKELVRQRDRAEGALERSNEELRALGYNSLKEATEALDKLSNELDEAEASLDEAVRKFEVAYKEQLDATTI